MAESVGSIALDLEINQGSLKKQLSGISANISGSTNKLSRSFDGISSTAKKAGAVIAAAFSVKMLKDFTAGCVELGSNLTEVQNVVDTVFPHMSSSMDKWAKSAAGSYGLSETMAKQYAGTFGAMSEAFGFTEKQAYDMSTALAGLSGDVASFYNITQDEAYTKLKSVFSGETESLKDLGIVMTQSALDEYAMANGFDKVTSKMSEQEKVSLRLAFVTNQLNNASGDFSKTAGSWANQVRILQLNFDSLKATLGQGFINLFTPIIKYINILVSRLSVLAAKFRAFTEVFTGQQATSSAMSDVASNATDTGDAIGGAADAADKLTDSTKKAAKASKQLMGFDKINKQSDSSDSSGAGNNASGTGSTGMADAFASSMDNMFEKTDVDAQAKKFAKKLKNAFKTGDFTEIGSIVGNKLNNALKSISWTKIKKSTKKAAKSVATFLNGCFETKGLWKNVGKTIAQALNTAVLGIDTFVKNFHWKSAAKAVADTFNGFVKKTDWKQIGKTIADSINGITEYITTLVKEIDWGNVAKAIGDTLKEFCKTIKWGPLIEVLAGALTIKLAGLGAKIGMNKVKSAFGEWVSGTLMKGLKAKLTGGVAEAGLETAAGKSVESAVAGGLGKAGTSASLKAAATSVGGTVALCIATAIAGFKIGNELYKNCGFVQKMSDGIVNAVGDAVTGKTSESKGISGLQKKAKELKQEADKSKKSLAQLSDSMKLTGNAAKFAKLTTSALKVSVSDTDTASHEARKGLIDLANSNDKVESSAKKANTSLSNVNTTIKNTNGKTVTVTYKANTKDTDTASHEATKGISKLVSLNAQETMDYTNKINLAKSAVDKTVKVGADDSKYQKAVGSLTIPTVLVKLKPETSMTELARKWAKEFRDNWKPTWSLNIKGKDGTVTQTMNSAYWVPAKKDGGVFKNGKWSDVTRYAKGGLPNTGQLFAAREKGPELVGKIGNSTAVVNNGQIVASVASGVYSAVAKALQTLVGGLSVKQQNIAPALACVNQTTSSNDTNKLISMAKQAAELSTTNSSEKVIELLTQILMLLKTLNLDIYMDGERLTRKVTSIINAHTNANGGRCELI